MAIISATHPTMVQYAERFSQSGLNFPEVSIETQTFESVCAFVRRNAAIGLVDFITAVRYMDELDIVFFAPKVFYSIHLLRPADRPTSRLGEQFEDLLEKKLSELCEIDMGINSYNR
jgi:DNA-binding transcriptional LysR family regulator